MASHSPCLRLLVFTTVLTFLAFTGNRVSFCSLSLPFFFPPVCVIVSALRSREVEKGELALCKRKEGILSRTSKAGVGGLGGRTGADRLMWCLSVGL